MAQVHDACLLELVEELGNDRVRDLFRELLERALQELIDAELTAQFGVGPHEPTETRTNRPAGPDPTFSTGYSRDRNAYARRDHF